MAFDNLYCIVDNPVQREIPGGIAPVGPHVFKGHRIGKLVVRQKLAVAVVDFSPGRFQNTFLADGQGKVVQIALPVQDLQVEKTRNQDRSHGQEEDDQEDHARTQPHRRRPALLFILVFSEIIQ